MTKNEAKIIKSLQEKKNRNELGLFLVEGAKNVIELLNSDFEIENLFITEDFYNKNEDILKNNPPSRLRFGETKYEIATQEELEKNGSLESNDSAIAIVKIPSACPVKSTSYLTGVIPAQAGIQESGIDSIRERNDNIEIILALDEIKDPGNLGTIIRIADWYGIKKIIASNDTVDFYNPKVISATKGSFTRVQIFYTDLAETLPKIGLPIFGTFMKGENVHTFDFPKSGILIMGNESKGISEKIEKLITKKITIPSFGKAESLNVSIATAIVLDNWLNQSTMN
jgi:RNA methyltransferase, TrmH family